MIVLAMITYAAPGLFGHDQDAGESAPGLWAFWLQMAGMFGMTMAFAAAGISQTYLERIMGLGFLETQQKIQVHFLMVLGTGLLFVLGVGLYLYDFFFLAPKRRTAPAVWPVSPAEAER
jgi:nitric oxide reductase subunit B